MSSKKKESGGELTLEQEVVALRRSCAQYKMHNENYRVRVKDQDKCISELLDERQRSEVLVKELNQQSDVLRKQVEMLKKELSERAEECSTLKANLCDAACLIDELSQPWYIRLWNSIF